MSRSERNGCVLNRGGARDWQAMALAFASEGAIVGVAEMAVIQPPLKRP